MWSRCRTRARETNCARCVRCAPTSRRLASTAARCSDGCAAATPSPTSGLSDQSVALIVKRRARAAGVPAAELSGHSLRAGYATAAAAAGVEERKIANVTRHKNLAGLRRLHPHPPPAFDDVGDVL
jgi:integrase